MISKKIMLSIVLAAGIILSGQTSSITHAQSNEGYLAVQTINQNTNYFKTLNYGATGDSVTQIQYILNLYFNAGISQDGIYGSCTKDAVKKVQKELDIDSDGIYGPKTAQAILNYIESLNSNKGTNSITVKEVQKKLLMLGYKVTLNGNTDDATTCKALTDIQQKYLLPVTGKINTETLNEIEDLLKGASDETTTFKSDTNYYISINSGDHLCKIYKKNNDGEWKDFKNFDILSNNMKAGNYRLGLQGKTLNLTGTPMNNFSEIDGLNVFYSAEQDTNYGIRLTDENAKIINSLPKNTTIKVF